MTITKTPIFNLVPLIITIFLIITTPTHSQDTSEDTDSDCTDKYIHIVPLPQRFNLDLLTNCSQYQPFFDNFCPYLANHGLGQKTHNRSRSWYRTDYFMLELIFHRRLLEYPCLTSNPSHASAVFLPYYASLDALRYLYGPDVNASHRHGIELYDYIQENVGSVWRRYMGHDHFLVMARPAWDFSRPLGNGNSNDGDDDDPADDDVVWGTSFLELSEFFNVSVLTFESRAWPWQEHSVPYPTSFHPPSLALFENWIRRVRRSRRSSLMLFAGGGGTSTSPNIRRSIRLECEGNVTGSFDGNASFVGGEGGYVKMCDFVDCSNGICEHDPIRFMRPMLQASFCLQPPGDTPTRRSTFDAILAGCIPVFFEELSAKKQYGWHLPEEEYEEFSVFIPKEEVVSKGLRIMDVLMSIPKHQVRRMREKVVELIPRIVYRRHGSSLGLRAKKDAFDIAVEGVLQKIKSRVKEFELSSAQ